MIVATDNLSKEYDGVYRVQELDIRIKEGDIYGFLGPNGAGKSTTMKMLLGLVKPTSGTIEIMGKPFNEKTRRDILSSVGYNTDEIVSSDIIGMRFGSLFDATQTMVVNLENGTSQVQVVSWYDNENSYTSQMVRTIKYFAELG